MSGATVITTIFTDFSSHKVQNRKKKRDPFHNLYEHVILEVELTKQIQTTQLKYCWFVTGGLPVVK